MRFISMSVEFARYPSMYTRTPRKTLASRAELCSGNCSANFLLREARYGLWFPRPSER